MATISDKNFNELAHNNPGRLTHHLRRQWKAAKKHEDMKPTLNIGVSGAEIRLMFRGRLQSVVTASHGDSVKTVVERMLRS